MISNKRLLIVMMLGLAALVITGCSNSGGDEEETAPAPTSTTLASTVPPAPSPTTKPSAHGSTSTPEKSGTGTLEVRVTDAPDPSITAVYVTTDNIEVSATGEGWISVIDEEITFELLALEGVEAILGTAQLAVGKYTQVRLSVPEVEVEKDGELVIAEVPSDTIKLVGTFEIVDDFKTFISLDFEVDKSLVDRQRQGFLFKPVIKLAIGEPGFAGAETVELTDKPEKGNPPPQPVPTRVTPPGQPTTVPATMTAVPPTSTPEPTATPTATPDAVGAFFLDIIEPEDGIGVVAVDSFEVIGRTSVDALVSVNDTFVDVAIDGTFTLTVELVEGTNEVEVVASTTSGDESSIVLVIFFEPAA